MTPHPGFSLFTGNTATYTPPLAITIANSNIVANSTVLLRNITKGTELEVVVGTPLGGYSFNTLLGPTEAVSAGDTINIRATYAQGTSYYENYTESAVASAAGITFLGTQKVWSAANGLGIDGSIQTEFTADYPNIEIDIASPDPFFAVGDLVAWLCYIQTTANGIRNYFGAASSTNTANWKLEVGVVDTFLDNTQSVTITQNDEIILMRSDNIYPQQAPTSGGGGIGMIQSGLVFVTTVAGASVITGDIAQVLAAVDAIPAAVMAESQSDPIWSRVVAVTEENVGGSGTEANPWGPA